MAIKRRLGDAYVVRLLEVQLLHSIIRAGGEIPTDYAGGV